MISPQVHLIFKYGATLFVNGLVPGEMGACMQYITLLRPVGGDRQAHLFQKDVVTLIDEVTKGLEESAETGKVPQIQLPFGLGR